MDARRLLAIAEGATEMGKALMKISAVAGVMSLVVLGVAVVADRLMIAVEYADYADVD